MARAAGVALAGFAAAGAAGPAWGQLLPQLGAPQFGAPVELGDLRRTFERAYGPIAVQPGQPAWTFRPAIDVDVLATDNAAALALGGVGKRGSELVTTVGPSIAIQGASQRLTGNLFYAPQLRMFARESRQTSFGHNLNATGKATILEDLLFLNASAYINEYSRFGGLGQGAALARQDRVQTTSVSIGPQLRHTFADYGVLDLGYTFSHLTQSGRSLRVNTPFGPALTPGDTITNTAQATFTSGQYFGRINFALNATRIEYDGPGVLKNAHRHSETLDLGYAATRTVTLLGTVGHQDIHYGGIRPIRISEGIWSVGVRWTPDPDTSFTLRYGYRDGGDNFSFEGTMAPTARTRVSASYSEAMASAADELQYALGRSTSVGAAIVIDKVTGMPVLVNNNFAGAQGGVSRVRRATLSAVLLQDIDTFTLSFNRDDRNTLTSDVPGAAPNITYYNASLGWQRELGPGLRGNAQVSYGERTATGFGNQDVLSLTAGVTWSLSETLSTRASYTYTRSGSRQPGLSYDASLISLGVHKSF